MNGVAESNSADPGQDHSGPMLDVSDLAVSFGGQSVVSGVDFTVDRGSLVGLVGPNGAGKTTVLRTVKGTLDPDRGTVRVDGEPVSDRSAKAVSRLVASTPQSTDLSFDFTVRQTVEMGRTPHLGRFDRMDEADRRAVERAMERASVAQFADRPFTSLSGGERQRVLLARALAQETPVLLLDEPTASLDINHAVRTLELVRSLVDSGKAAIAAIHDLNLAARYCDELVLLAGGEVRAAGRPVDVLTSDTLRDAFDAETLVTTQPGTDAPLVTPLAEHESVSRRVHVVGTGKPAAAAVSKLVGAGCRVSVGVVPAGDAAAERAADLDCEAVTVPAFAGIDDTARERAVDLAAAADAVVIAGEPGDGNSPVIEAGSARLTVETAEGSHASSGHDTVPLAALPAAVGSLPPATTRGATPPLKQSTTD
ncbi:heme ABC transporter ATP-binding protein [Haloarcula sp. CBA1130]|uniref:heme ABC transporter ATP-binding protein n=1 Tax=unclassified Haloarcula TaxID=2624677 RepID=UPI0012454520|nr:MULTISPECIES: heme ABC transporter ATP-binding protein [unclassified Haloarcula]KAA9398886.1 heme ABC transporter ATP-binding protein [Haloarcula sp. CBA1129]KAA9403400.1 heme ABC transporter ATP-binding protein [Haloarcula sp. CBA1130]